MKRKKYSQKQYDDLRANYKLKYKLLRSKKKIVVPDVTEILFSSGFGIEDETEYYRGSEFPVYGWLMNPYISFTLFDMLGNEMYFKDDTKINQN